MIANNSPVPVIVHLITDTSGWTIREDILYLERGVNASYQGILNRIYYRRNIQHWGNPSILVACVFSLQRF